MAEVPHASPDLLICLRARWMEGSSIVDRASREADPALQADLRMTLVSVSHPNEIEDLWLDLERRSDCSFFQSWGWIGCWLRHLPDGLDPRLLTMSADGELVGLGILIPRQQTRHVFVRSRSLYLNETGDPQLDAVGLEYNGFLADRRLADTVVCRCLEWLAEAKEDWDELNLGGLDPASTGTYGRIAGEIGLMTRARDRKRYDYVDLEAVRQGEGDYLGLLSRNTRYQIRRSLRRYEDDGPLSVRAAGDADEARDILAELRQLHQAYWKGRRHAGSFATPFFDDFHRDLVANRFGAGEIQLLRITAGPKLIGCLYNFVKDGRVCAYQSGFNYDPDSRLKPGLVSHYLAIEHNLAAGMRIYDFMAGEGQHKRSLGTRHGEMTWLVLQRPNTKFRLENALRSLKHLISARSRAPS